MTMTAWWPRCVRLLVAILAVGTPMLAFSGRSWREPEVLHWTDGLTATELIVPGGDASSTVVTLGNRSRTPIRIASAESSCSCMRVQLPQGSVIPAGGAIDVALQMQTVPGVRTTALLLVHPEDRRLPALARGIAMFGDVPLHISTTPATLALPPAGAGPTEQQLDCVVVGTSPREDIVLKVGSGSEIPAQVLEATWRDAPPPVVGVWSCAARVRLRIGSLPARSGSRGAIILEARTSSASCASQVWIEQSRARIVSVARGERYHGDLMVGSVTKDSFPIEVERPQEFVVELREELPDGFKVDGLGVPSTRRAQLAAAYSAASPGTFAERLRLRARALDGAWFEDFELVIAGRVGGQ